MSLYEKKFIIPNDSQYFIMLINENCKVIKQEIIDERTYIKALVSEEIYNRCKCFEIRNKAGLGKQLLIYF